MENIDQPTPQEEEPVDQLGEDDFDYDFDDDFEEETDEEVAELEAVHEGDFTSPPFDPEAEELDEDDGSD